MKNKRPVFKCKECKWLNRVPSLFDGIEVLECSNGNHNTINLTDVGGGVYTQDLSTMVSFEGGSR